MINFNLNIIKDLLNNFINKSLLNKKKTTEITSLLGFDENGELITDEDINISNNLNVNGTISASDGITIDGNGTVITYNYNANTDRNIEANRTAAFDYIIDATKANNICGLIRYEDGYYYQYKIDYYIEYRVTEFIEGKNAPYIISWVRPKDGNWTKQWESNSINGNLIVNGAFNQSTFCVIPYLDYRQMPSQSTDTWTFFKEWVTYIKENYADLITNSSGTEKTIVSCCRPNASGWLIGHTASAASITDWSGFTYQNYGGASLLFFGYSNGTWYQNSFYQGDYLPLSGGTISGALSVTGNETIGGTLTTTGAETVGGNLTVSGTGTSSIAGSLSVKGKIAGTMWGSNVETAEDDGYYITGHGNLVHRNSDTNNFGIQSSQTNSDGDHYSIFRVNYETGNVIVGNASVTGGNLSTYGSITSNAHSTPIGTVVSQSSTRKTSDTSVSSGVTNIAQFTLTPGTWVITGGCRVIVATEGCYGLSISNSNSSVNSAYDGTFSCYLNTGNRRPVVTRILVVSSSTTYYLNLYCQSAASYSYQDLYAVRIA